MSGVHPASLALIVAGCLSAAALGFVQLGSTPKPSAVAPPMWDSVSEPDENATRTPYLDEFNSGARSINELRPAEQVGDWGTSAYLSELAEQADVIVIASVEAVEFRGKGPEASRAVVTYRALRTLKGRVAFRSTFVSRLPGGPTRGADGTEWLGHANLSIDQPGDRVLLVLQAWGRQLDVLGPAGKYRLVGGVVAHRIIPPYIESWEGRTEADLIAFVLATARPR